MKMVASIDTYEASIFIGLRKYYSEEVYSIKALELICQKFCNEEQVGVRVTPTKFIYVNGNEPGAIVTFINYPRFPTSNARVMDYAMKLAKILLEELDQNRCTVKDNKVSYLLEREQTHEQNS